MRRGIGPANIRASTMSESQPPTEDCLDTQGLVCPEPLMLLRNRVRQMIAGETLHVVATDPTTQRDFSNFCHFMGHELIATRIVDGVYHYQLRKGDKR